MIFGSVVPVLVQDLLIRNAAMCFLIYVVEQRSL
jgi:hypothetical protein